MFSARSLSLFAVLYGTWLLLSGIWEPFLMISGVVACVFVVVIAHRLEVVDGEGHPVHLTWRALVYYPWLFWQITRSNARVARLIVTPSLPISPAAAWIPAGQSSSVGLVTLANSITLTPGTVSLTVEKDRIYVHALEATSIRDLESGEMDRRVCQMEGLQG